VKRLEIKMNHIMERKKANQPERFSPIAPVAGRLLQRTPVNSVLLSDVPPVVHEVLITSGQPLDTGARVYMGSRFGHDFSKVHIHADTKAAESAQAVNALAYTVGNDVVFGAGQYVPSTTGGQRLIGHELTHVVQQESAPPALDTSQNISSTGDISECEAEATTRNFQFNGLFHKNMVDGLQSTPIQISRQEADPRIGGPQSSIEPAYTIDDLKGRLATFNLGAIRGDDVISYLNEGGWRVAFWNEPGHTGLTDTEHKLILLRCEASLISNVSTLFHEAMHVMRPVPGSTGLTTDTEAIWANLEEEIMAEYQEILFLQANAATDPTLTASSSFSDDWDRIATMNQGELYRYFRDEVIVWIIIGKLIEYRALLNQFNNDVGQIIESPRMRVILDRVILGVHPSPLVVPPTPPRPRLPSLIRIRQDFYPELLESVEEI
jgi:hypothetical protein